MGRLGHKLMCAGLVLTGSVGLAGAAHAQTSSGIVAGNVSQTANQVQSDGTIKAVTTVTSSASDQTSGSVGSGSASDSGSQPVAKPASKSGADPINSAADQTPQTVKKTDSATVTAGSSSPSETAKSAAEGGPGPDQPALTATSQPTPSDQSAPAPRPASLDNQLKTPRPQPLVVQQAGESGMVETTPAPVSKSSQPNPLPAGAGGDVLMRLSSALAGVVVPALAGGGTPPVIQHWAGLGRAPLTQKLGLLIVTWISLFLLWLRRSGFTRGARSDASSFLTFATPVKVSFAWARVPTQNSLFCGVRNKTLTHHRREVI